MTSVVIVAGGKGQRFGGNIPKQFLKLENSKMVIEHTIDKFENNNNIGEIILVVPLNHIDFLKEVIEKNQYKKVKGIIAGGETRQDSVKNGLDCINGDYVFVHDGVRPFISEHEINELSQLVKKHGAVINSTRVKDTIKISKNNFVESTPKRDFLLAASTPQCFKTEILKKAHLEAKKNNYIGTDESDIVEKINEKVYLFEGSYNNIKITTEIDLIIGNIILEGEKNGAN